MEVLVCQDAGLMALDSQMASVYAAALKKPGQERPPLADGGIHDWVPVGH